MGFSLLPLLEPEGKTAWAFLKAALSGRYRVVKYYNPADGGSPDLPWVLLARRLFPYPGWRAVNGWDRGKAGDYGWQRNEYGNPLASVADLAWLVHYRRIGAAPRRRIENLLFREATLRREVLKEVHLPTTAVLLLALAADPNNRDLSYDDVHEKVIRYGDGRYFPPAREAATSAPPSQTPRSPPCENVTS